MRINAFESLEVSDKDKNYCENITFDQIISLGNGDIKLDMNYETQQLLAGRLLTNHILRSVTRNTESYARIFRQSLEQSVYSFILSHSLILDKLIRESEKNLLRLSFSLVYLLYQHCLLRDSNDSCSECFLLMCLRSSIHLYLHDGISKVINCFNDLVSGKFILPLFSLSKLGTRNLRCLSHCSILYESLPKLINVLEHISAGLQETIRTRISLNLNSYESFAIFPLIESLSHYYNVLFEILIPIYHPMLMKLSESQIKSKNIQYVLLIPSFFLSRLKNNEFWSLISLPNAGITSDLESIYEMNESKENTEKINSQKLIEYLSSTNMFSYLLCGNVIQSYNLRYVGNPLFSSFCVSSILPKHIYSSVYYGYLTVDSFVMGPATTEFIEGNEGKLGESFDISSFESEVRSCVSHLNRCVDLDESIASFSSNFDFRSIGLTLIGETNALDKLGIEFDEPSALSFIKLIYSIAYFHACVSSIQLSIEYGSHEKFEQSSGVFLFDRINSGMPYSPETWGQKEVGLYHVENKIDEIGPSWESLGSKIRKHGIRNSTLLMNVQTELEYLVKNGYFHKTLFPVENRSYLDGVCIEHTDTSDLVSKLIRMNIGGTRGIKLDN